MHHDDTIATQVGQPVGVRSRHADRRAHGPGGQGLVRTRGDAEVLGPLRQAGLAGRDPHLHRGRDRAARRGLWSISNCRRGTTSAKRSSPGPRPPRSPNSRDSRTTEKEAEYAMGILDGRVAVVTGSGRGIGREFALSMAREGANIVINDVGVSLDGQGTDEDPAAQTVQRHQGARRGRGPELRVGDRLRRRRPPDPDRDRRVRPDRHPGEQRRDRAGPLAAQDDARRTSTRSCKVHMYGTFNMRPARGGPHEGSRLRPDHQRHLPGRACAATSARPNYGAAKAAIMGMTFVWSIELGKYGITVNAMSPAGRPG